MRHVAILGAGPAGLAAAQAALALGATVTVLDEGEHAGGQFWRHQPGITDARLQHQWRRFERLSAALESATVHRRASVWSVEHGERLWLHAVVGPHDAAERAGITVEADALVLATGAHDRALPIPGWTLPGVTTAGAAQALAKRDGVTVGTRTLVAGAGPFLLPVAQSLRSAGSEVVEVLEASALGTLARGWAARPWELLAMGHKGAELAEYVGDLARGRTPYRIGEGVVRILGSHRVEGAVVARMDADWRPVPGTERTVACDAVALGHGFTPRLEAAIQCGCEIRPDRFVAVDDRQATSVAGVFAAGEVTGIGGADGALAEGVIAGFTAAGGALGDQRLRAAVRARTRATAFAARLQAAHGIRPGWTAWLTPDTVLCRCESTTVETVRAHAAASPRGFRLATRAGIGACQGRTCGRAVEDVVRAAGGTPSPADHRPVLGSVRLGEVAARSSR